MKKPAAARPAYFIQKAEFNAGIRALKAQGLDNDDAVETLSRGLREANGIRTRPVEASALPAL